MKIVAAMLIALGALALVACEGKTEQKPAPAAGSSAKPAGSGW